MARFKPQASYITRASREDYYNGRLKSPTLTRPYKTYRELKKDLPEMLERNIDADGVFVVRSRRNEWGEWFEYWQLDAEGKPYISKQGWS